MMSSNTRRAFAAAGLLSALACADSAIPPTDPSEASAADRSATQPALDVANAIAVAMADEAVRHQIRDAMQASHYPEHKILLHEFMASSAGELVRSTATGRGVDDARLGRSLAKLPPMDFYVPFDEHRQSWTGESDVLVGATMDPDDPTLFVFDQAGSELSLHYDDGQPSRVLFILHPAERKQGVIATSTRGHATIEGAGETLQPSFMTVSSTADASTDTVAVTSFRINFGDGWAGDAEPYFTGELYGRDPYPYGELVWCCMRSWQHNDAYPNVTYNIAPPGGIIGFRYPRGWGEFLRVELHESDFGDDKYHGFNNITTEGLIQWYNDLGHFKGEAYIAFGVDDRRTVTRMTVTPSSATRNVGQTQPLTATVYDQFDYLMPWKTVAWSSSNGNVATVSSTGAQSATATATGGGVATITASVDGVSASSTITSYAPGLSVTIYGSTKAQPNQACFYTSYVSGGSGNYSYRWNTGSRTPDATYYTSTGQTSFTMTLEVLDNTGYLIGTASKTVTVSSTGMPCAE